MKRFLRNLTAAMISILLIMSVAYGRDGSATQQHYSFGGLNVLVVSWIAGTAGAFTDYETRNIDGVVGLVETNPGATSPTASYDITIKNKSGLDIMGGLFADRSATSPESAAPYDSVNDVPLNYPVIGPLTIGISGNSVTGALGTITFFYWVDKK